MEFQRETLTIEEIEALAKDHYEEVGSFKEFEFNIHRESLIYGQLIDALRYFTAREDGKIIGYNLFIISPDMWHSKQTAAMELAIFVSKKYRGIGPRFIKWIDSVIDADIIYRGTKGASLERLGYTFTNIVYGKTKNGSCSADHRGRGVDI